LTLIYTTIFQILEIILRLYNSDLHNNYSQTISQLICDS